MLKHGHPPSNCTHEGSGIRERRTSPTPCSRRSYQRMQLASSSINSLSVCHANLKPQHSLLASSLQLDLQPELPGAQHRTTSSPVISRRELISSGAAAYLASQAASLAAPSAAAAAAASLADPHCSSSDSLPVVPRADLAPGLSCSRVIKGCWQLSGGHAGESQTDRTSGQAAVEDFAAFVAAGITTFDAADHYGPAEMLIGRFRQRYPELTPQTQAFTKYCVFTPLEMSSLNGAAVKAAVDRSRQRLGVEALDLLQFYWADYNYDKYVDAALYLSDLQSSGVIKAVGMTNFDVPRLQKMVDAGVTIASNQVQYSLLDTRPDTFMVPFCSAHNIQLLPYGVMAGGFLSDKYVGVSPREVSVNTYSKGKYASVLGQVGGWTWLQNLLKVLAPIAAKHGTTIADVAARWVLQRPQVPAVIVGARNASHVTDHQRLFTFQLDEADLGEIQGVLEQRPGRPQGDCYTWERGGKW